MALDGDILASKPNTDNSEEESEAVAEISYDEPSADDDIIIDE